MTGSIAIDVALGLSFIFLLYSLLSTIVQEMIARWLGLRSRMLLKAVARMLDDTLDNESWKVTNYVREIFKNLKYFFYDSYSNRPVTKRFFKHPTIKYLGESSWSSKPSYLNASTFSQVLIDMLRNPKGGNYDGTEDQMDLIRKTLSDKKFLGFEKDSETLRQLKIFSAEAKGDVNKFKSYVEDWYTETMSRCTGWFKKQTQFILFIVGMAIAIAFNVDTIGIVKILSTDPKARQQLVELSSATLKQFDSGKTKIDTTISKEALNKAYSEVMKSINESNSILGLGWGSSCSLALYQPTIASMLAGWIITAFAISLGAPFWFDILNKVMMLRATQQAQYDSVSTSTVDPKDRVG